MFSVVTIQTTVLASSRLLLLNIFMVSYLFKIHRSQVAVFCLVVALVEGLFIKYVISKIFHSSRKLSRIIFL